MKLRAAHVTEFFKTFPAAQADARTLEFFRRCSDAAVRRALPWCLSRSVVQGSTTRRADTLPDSTLGRE